MIFSKVFHILVNLCAFVMYACEDTTSLKFGGVIFECMCFMYMFMFVWCEALSLVFVYGFENLMKIN